MDPPIFVTTSHFFVPPSPDPLDTNHQNPPKWQRHIGRSTSHTNKIISFAVYLATGSRLVNPPPTLHAIGTRKQIQKPCQFHNRTMST